jgi:hypothetical protein
MVIKASAAAEIRQLVAALGGDDDVRREAAIARLAIIGARAVDRLIAAYGSTQDRGAKIAILRALEPARDTRTGSLARGAIAEGGDLAVAAASALRALLDSPHPPTRNDTLDVLVATALDPAAERRVRLASFEALQDVPGGVRERVAAALERDPGPGLTAGAAGLPRDAAAADAVWQDALEGRLPDTPAGLRDAAKSRAPVAALSGLQKMIDAVRAHEGAATPARRPEWQALRGALHQALALRGSRVAVYDLRETVAAARRPIPASFLAALHAIGDESCVEALAAACANAAAADTAWRHQLGAAFRAIAAREKISRRHSAMKRILARWPEAALELANMPSRTRPRPPKPLRT